MIRSLTHAERGELIARLGSWTGASGLERLTLFQLVGCARLMTQAHRVLVDVTVDELGRLLGRSASTVRASLAALRTSGLLSREESERSMLDLTALARAIGFDIRACPAVADPFSRTSWSGLPDEGSSAPVLDLGAPANGADDPVETLRISGGSNASSMSQEYINKHNNLLDSPDSDEGSGFSIERLRATIAELRQPEIAPHLARPDDIRIFLDHAEALIGSDWSEANVSRAGVEAVAAAAVFGPCSAGPGLSKRLIARAGERFGAGLLAHALYALVHGHQPKGLLISMIRAQRSRAAYSVFCLDKAVTEARHILAAQAARSEAEARASAREKASAHVRRFVEMARSAPGLTAADERLLAHPSPSAMAEMRPSGDGERLVIAFPRKADFNGWKSIFDRVLAPVYGVKPDELGICEGALNGGRQVRLVEALAS